MIKARFSDALNYFSFRTLFLGAVVGTAFFPGPGTILGFIFACGLGIVSSLISHVLITRSQTPFFKEELDLDVDRAGRWFAVRVGAWTGLASLIFWLIFCRIATASSLPRNTYFLQDPSVLFLGSLVSFWSGLLSAAGARNYPRWLLQKRVKEEQLSIDPQLIPPQPNVTAAIWRLFQSGSHVKRFLFGMVIAAFVMLYNMSASRSFDDYPPSLFAQYMVVGGGLAELIWLHVSIVNGVLMTVLKQLVLDDYFPHLSNTYSRRILIVISFIITLLTSWVSLIFAPLIAFYMAAAVYRTLALPNESPEKAKRKEKNTLTLDEEGDAVENRLLTDEEKLLEARQ